MSERIDHAAEAIRAIGNMNYPMLWGRADAIAYAQTHATLALVEQQRIANLIQMRHVPVGDLDDNIRQALHAAFHRGPDNWEEALGL